MFFFFFFLGGGGENVDDRFFQEMISCENIFVLLLPSITISIAHFERVIRPYPAIRSHADATLIVPLWLPLFSLSPFAPVNLASRDGFGRPVPPQPAHSPHHG